MRRSMTILWIVSPSRWVVLPIWRRSASMRIISGLATHLSCRISLLSRLWWLAIIHSMKEIWWIPKRKRSLLHAALPWLLSRSVSHLTILLHSDSFVGSKRELRGEVMVRSSSFEVTVCRKREGLWFFLESGVLWIARWDGMEWSDGIDLPALQSVIRGFCCFTGVTAVSLASSRLSVHFTLRSPCPHRPRSPYRCSERISWWSRLVPRREIQHTD